MKVKAKVVKNKKKFSKIVVTKTEVEEVDLNNVSDEFFIQIVNEILDKEYVGLQLYDGKLFVNHELLDLPDDCILEIPLFELTQQWFEKDMVNALEDIDPTIDAFEKSLAFLKERRKEITG